MSAELRSLTPPSRLVARAAGRSNVDWLAIGDGWITTMRDLGELSPHDRVLDVGCGVGRMAIPLSSYLEPPGSYEGFDVQPSAIEWCKREIEPRWPLGRFQLVDVRNRQYRLRGGTDAATFRFPFDDAQFDFVFATSVFTHMRRDEVDNYLAEMRRVLAPGGRLFTTYYLLNPAVRDAIDRGGARYRFRHAVGPRCYANRRVWPVAIAFDEDVVEQLYRANGFSPPSIHHGAWSGAYTDARHGQDTVVAAATGTD
jgi:SAM-dependent methyltransferase